MLHLVVKAGKSWKPVRRYLSGSNVQKHRQLSSRKHFFLQKNKEVCTSSMLNTKLLQALPPFLPFGVHTQTTRRCFRMFLILQRVMIHRVKIILFCYSNNSGHFSPLAGLVKQLNLPVWCNTSHKELCKSQVSAETFSRAWNTMGMRKAQPASPCK